MTTSTDRPERTIMEVHQHWVPAGLWWRVLLLLIVVAGSAYGIAAGQVPPTLQLPLVVLDLALIVFLLVIPYVLWRSEVFRLTDRRLVLESGILTRRSKSVPLVRVQDVTTEVGVLGRILGYGTVLVENAGETPGHDELSDIPGPAIFRETLLKFASQARQDDL